MGEVEVTSRLTATEWLNFQVGYFKYMTKRKRRRCLFLLPVFLLLLLHFDVPLVDRLRFYLTTAEVPLAQVLYFSADKIFTTVVTMVLVFRYLFLVFVRYSPNHHRKIMRRQMEDCPIEESRISLTTKSIGMYSDSTDFRLTWKRVTKVVHTDELIVLFGWEPMCIILSKVSLTKKELKSVEEKMNRYYSGEVLNI